MAITKKLLMRSGRRWTPAAVRPAPMPHLAGRAIYLLAGAPQVALRLPASSVHDPPWTGS